MLIHSKYIYIAPLQYNYSEFLAKTSRRSNGICETLRLTDVSLKQDRLMISPGSTEILKMLEKLITFVFLECFICRNQQAETYGNIFSYLSYLVS